VITAGSESLRVHRRFFNDIETADAGRRSRSHRRRRTARDVAQVPDDEGREVAAEATATASTEHRVLITARIVTPVAGLIPAGSRM
jgi:hypothetical protein